jgi:SAM-dependent methyltransferase
MPWRRTKNKIRRRRATLALLADLPPGRVLDAPCGDGTLARELSARGWRVCAADIAPVHIDGVRSLRLDLDEPLPFSDGAFDAVVSLEGIEHLLSPARCLAELCRVLRPGGRLVVTTPNVNNLQSRWHYLIAGRFSGFRPLTRRSLSAAEGGLTAAEGGLTAAEGELVAHVTPPYLPTIVYVLSRHGVTVEHVDVTMVRTRQWLALPLTVPLWLSSRRAPAGTIARALGSFMLLLGRNVILQGVKRG